MREYIVLTNLAKLKFEKKNYVLFLFYSAKLFGF